MRYKVCASLDTERGLSVMRLLHKVANERRSAILVVTHDTRMVSEVDGTVHLRDGQVINANAESSDQS